MNPEPEVEPIDPPDKKENLTLAEQEARKIETIKKNKPLTTKLGILGTVPDLARSCYEDMEWLSKFPTDEKWCLKKPWL